MKTRSEELDLATQVWNQALSHLQRRIARAEAGEPEDVDLDDVGSVETTGSGDCVAAMQRQIMIYSMCLDWAAQQRAQLEGLDEDSHTQNRDRFYRLMAVLAKAELDRDDHLRSVAFVGSSRIDHPSNQQAVDELRATASAALTRLVGGAALARHSLRSERPLPEMIKPVHFA